ncbi:WYL domain-containing protein [Staphylococcus sp. ACRSN]|uniref:helix-turn-helix transcriptional regulator n=1 Tax=Staphylococcus sp. ACRSN TaxID=2918214 RepID=UPI001EF28DF8|nr:WYL domain-containing protein [Staphylococcus sp. ACRSN]MCG7338359.1 WYL domain-containing protein [Staphylococcus sp. ACRSN]
MKKAERLNMELIFLRDKTTFHLKDLMNEFNISKSTAIRDIKDLESMGLALYVESGRFGGYKILTQNLLTPVYFNDNEILAIFYALKSMNALTTTPFEKTYTQINEKLYATISDHLMKDISQTLNYIHYHSVSPVKHTPYLSSILNAIKNNQIISITYSQYERELYDSIQVYELFYRSGIWFFSGINLNTQAWGIFRSDYIDDLQINDNAEIKYTRQQLSKFEEHYESEYHDIAFKCELTAFGVELFLKKSYPNMTLEYIDNKPYIVGGYNQSEFQYMIDYLISLGENVKIIYPNKLINGYLNKVRSLINKYE